VVDELGRKQPVQDQKRSTGEGHDELTATAEASSDAQTSRATNILNKQRVLGITAVEIKGSLIACGYAPPNRTRYYPPV
jgi:hypothetical protein